MAVHSTLECSGLRSTRQKIRNPPHFRHAWYDCRNHLERVDVFSLPSLQGIWTLDRKMHTYPSHPCCTKETQKTGTLPPSTEGPYCRNGEDNISTNGRRVQ